MNAQSARRAPTVVVRKNRKLPAAATPINYPASRFQQSSRPIGTVEEVAAVKPRPTAQPAPARVQAQPAQASRPAEEPTTGGKRNETKREKFLRVVLPRVKKLLWSIDQVAYGGERERYDYTRSDAAAIDKAVTTHLLRMRIAYGLPTETSSVDPHEFVGKVDDALAFALADAERELEALRESTIEAMRREAQMAKQHAESLAAKLREVEMTAATPSEILTKARAKVTQDIAGFDFGSHEERSPLEDLLHE